jgi:crossover junction endodeoxyribonuclease RuvC
MARFGSKAWRNFDPSVQPIAEPVGTSPTQGPVRILGLDPGSRRTGFGLIEIFDGEWRCLEHGRIEVERLPLAGRLGAIYSGVRRLLEQYHPQEVAIERVFVSRNVDSALKLGQARGAALAALGDTVQLAEYAPRAIKLATVGFGAADKLQVAHMMQTMLKPAGRLSADAADALAVAVCHAQHRKLAQLVSGSAG